MIHLEKLTYESFDNVFELKVKKVQMSVFIDKAVQGMRVA